MEVNCNRTAITHFLMCITNRACRINVAAEFNISLSRGQHTAFFKSSSETNRLSRRTASTQAKTSLQIIESRNISEGVISPLRLHTTTFKELAQPNFAFFFFLNSTFGLQSSPSLSEICVLSGCYLPVRRDRPYVGALPPPPSQL